MDRPPDYTIVLLQNSITLFVPCHFHIYSWESTAVCTDTGKMVLKSSISDIGSTTGVRPLPLSSLNHISLICRSIEDSTKFYQDVLGFVLLKRAESFGFDGAW